MCLITYIIVLVYAIDNATPCTLDVYRYSNYLRVLRLEAFLFVCNMSGIAIFMFTKVMLSRFGT